MVCRYRIRTDIGRGRVVHRVPVDLESGFFSWKLLEKKPQTNTALTATGLGVNTMLRPDNSHMIELVSL